MIDSHCHLDMIPYWGDAEPSWEDARREISEILDRAEQAGVTQVLNPGVEWKDFDRVLSLGEDPRILLALGIHPHDAKTWGPDGKDRLREYLKHPKVVAIGEIGLDYHYDFSPREEMIRAFHEQIELAREVKLPIIVHSREAHEDTLQVMKDAHASEAGGVMHCFSGSYELAKAAMDMGFYISFSGSVTFANAHRVRDVAKRIPLDRILIETDSPYMSPPPYRGKRCEPAYVVKIAETLAQVHEVSLETVLEKATENTIKLFKGRG